MREWLRSVFHMHTWVYVGDARIVLPTLGPYDPTPADRRTVTREKYVCATCGQTKLQEPWVPDYL